MSQQLISRSPDLKQLRNEGYSLEIRSGYLLVHGIPYVNSKGEIQCGILVTKLTLAGDVTTRPDNHVAYFVGDYPCREDGKEIEQIRNQSAKCILANGVVIDHTFSAKPQPSGLYENYFAKVTTYVAILSGPAQRINPMITAKSFSPIATATSEGSVFNYIDTSSSRAEIDVIAKKLALGKVAIVGLGGTGSYVLDLVAKTPIKEIHLFDGDEFLQHNAFRSPGAASIDELGAKPRKVDHFKRLYSNMHRGIVAHASNVSMENVEHLRHMDFVFLCLDNAAVKKPIIDKLDEFGVSFIDTGMGIYKADDSLGGAVRVTASTPQKRNHESDRISFSDGDGQNEYYLNIQIADLNSMNAAMAVIKWKKLLGFYLDFESEHHSTYTVELHLFTKEDRTA